MAKPKKRRPTGRELKAAYGRAEEIYRDHLLSMGVKMPRWGTATGYQLAILMFYRPDRVHKDTISDIVRQHLDVARDQQVRHLKRSGWNLKSEKGEHWIEDPYTAHAGYVREMIKQKTMLTAEDFLKIKSVFGNRCATCGAREGEPDPRYGDEVVNLQRGHRDPAKPLDIKNMIPQCQFCNKSYKDDFTFDERGRVRAVASPRPVLRASKEVRKRVKEALDKKKNG